MTIEVTEVQVRSGKQRKGEPFRNKNKIYFFLENESITQNLIDRCSRPHEEYKKFGIPKVLEHLKEHNPEIYNEVKDEKWYWRQSCGCSMCPCSPGFIGNTLGCQDIYVTIKAK